MIEGVPQKSKESSNVKPNSFEAYLASIEPEIITPHQLKNEPLEFAQEFRDQKEDINSEKIRKEIRKYIQLLQDFQKQSHNPEYAEKLQSALALFHSELYKRVQ